MVQDSVRQPLLAHSAEEQNTNVYELIHEISRAVRLDVDTALTWDQLNTPEINYSIIRPHLQKWSKSWNDAIIYALMVNRVQFLRLAEHDLAYAGLQTARAGMCELLAIKMLRVCAESELQLVSVLTKGFSPFQGAPEDVWRGIKGDREELEDDIGNALEMSIVSSAKHFLATPLAQKVINLIRSGRVVYTTASNNSLISDNYTSARRAQAGTSGIIERTLEDLTTDVPPGVRAKGQPAGVFLYDPRLNGWLDYTRLRIPRWRTWIEFLNFAILLGLFTWNLADRDLDRPKVSEIMFIIFTLGFSLDEFAASKEHGWTIYLASAWNAFDLSFILVFFVYLGMRIYAAIAHDPQAAQLSFDVLSMGACILFPRIAFFFIRDNVIIISLKAMIGDFVGFMSLAVVCFSGLLFTLWTLGRDTWTVRQIAWLMLQIWFGSSYLGFSASTSFHPIFGPILLVIYALSNTLLVTILISILSNRFAMINSNAKEEHLFQKTINTIEGVKSDAIFSYLPPLNILAFVILWPLSFVLSPPKLHKVNVFCIRLTSFPILMMISVYERWRWQSHPKPTIVSGSGIAPSPEQSFLVERASLLRSFLGAASASAISAVFDHTTEESDILIRADAYGASEDSGSKKDDDKLKPAPINGSKSRDISQQKTRIPETPTKDSGTTSTKGSIRSPLTKLWGRGKGNESTELVTSREEVDDLRNQLKEMRESQARMEALLRGMSKS